MRTFLLCDDDSGVLESLRRLLAERYGEAGVRADAFVSPEDALAEVEKGCRWDAAILDILMPGLDGARLAAAMREAGFAGEIIFLTSSREFAPESYEVKALDYLLKPLDGARLAASLDKLETSLTQRDSAFLTLTAGRTTRRVPLRDILFAEAGNHVTHFYLEGGEMMTVRGSFSGYTPALLADPRFAACHGSFVVNLDKIHALDGGDAVMSGGRLVPIAKRYTGFRRQYMDWLTREGERYDNP